VLVDFKDLQHRLAERRTEEFETAQARLQQATEKGPKKSDLEFYEVLKHSESESGLAPPADGDGTHKGAPDEVGVKKARVPPKSNRLKPMVTMPAEGIAPGETGPQPPAAAYVVQVASVKNPADAQQIIKNLSELGFKAHMVERQIQGKGSWHRIRIGGFADRKGALQTLERLKAAGYAPLVVKTQP